MVLASLGTPETVAIWAAAIITAAATLVAAVIGAWASVMTARIARETQRKVQTPGDGTLGEQMQAVKDAGPAS